MLHSLKALVKAAIPSNTPEGTGDFNLGANFLTVGGNDRSTTVSGIISGTGGSLTKTGTGTLTLSHEDNTYSSGTVLERGILNIAVIGAAGTGP